MDTIGIHKKLAKKEQTILMISHDVNFDELRSHLYGTAASLQKLEAIKLPNTQVNNELDKRILAELHSLGVQLEQEMDQYSLDTGAKLVL